MNIFKHLDFFVKSDNVCGSSLHWIAIGDYYFFFKLSLLLAIAEIRVWQLFCKSELRRMFAFFSFLEFSRESQFAILMGWKCKAIIGSTVHESDFYKEVCHLCDGYETRLW